ncbi:28S ribosomal protein S17, mitochondrial-like [Lytechinus variegatus]|uniref:28S ribosomal protein S17, mitochondrial-like n=1 Tax=Lytechinus variegatus TaxID=7654 RepID=UPI001BB2A5D9|nr:28S ribosomal protein S17, mitochondrial-like [Lytechinus variegatus]
MSGAARKILIGQVIGTKMTRTAKVRVNKLQLDPFVTQYFPKRSTVFAHDPEEAAKLGDIVLVKELPIKKSTHVKYQMERIIYSLGNVTDPITGKKCDCYSYWDEGEGSDGAPVSDHSTDSVDKEVDVTGNISRTMGDGKDLKVDGTPV